MPKFAPNHNTNTPRGETQSEASIGSLILLNQLQLSLEETFDLFKIEIKILINGSKMKNYNFLTFSKDIGPLWGSWKL